MTKEMISTEWSESPVFFREDCFVAGINIRNDYMDGSVNSHDNAIEVYGLDYDEAIVRRRIIMIALKTTTELNSTQGFFRVKQ